MLLNNPVLSKEYRLRMRSKRTPWLVTGYLFILGMIALMFIYLRTAASHFELGAGRELFMMLSVLQLAMIGFVTPGLTAGQISGERERQTLAVLLTTNLSPAVIVVSKLIASLSFVLFLVVSSLPLYAIVFLYGGLSIAQLVELFFFYVVAMLFLGSLGLMYSTFVQRTGVATVLTYGTVAVIVFGTAITGFFAISFYELNVSGGGGNNPFWVTVWFLLNPVYTVASLFGMDDFASSISWIQPYAFFLVVYGSLSLIFIVLTARRLSPVRRRRQRKEAISAERSSDG